MKGNTKPKMIFSEGADEHIRVKLKKKTSELPDKDATLYLRLLVSFQQVMNTLHVNI